MKRTMALIAIAASLIGGSLPGGAADYRGSEGAAALMPTMLPFPRSPRAQSVWDSRACWSGCQSYCTWGEASCLSRDPQGLCLKRTDDCDRSCQRSCRTYGGPLLPLDF